MLERMSARERIEWGIVFQIEAEAYELRRQGYDEEQIADAIECGGVVDGSDSGLLDALLDDDAKIERQRLILDAELVDDEEDD